MQKEILTEAFDSEPYELEYSVKPPAAEWYNFEEDETHKYRIEVNSPTQAKAGKLGKNVKVIRIGFKSSGTNFRPVIGRFKDAKRVIATILDILNRYKTDGKYGTKIQGFALQFKAETFGPYARLVKRIARMYLRQQFKVSESDWSPQEDQSYVWLVRKGKKFSDVFNGEDMLVAGVDLEATNANHTPAPVSTVNDPVIATPAEPASERPRPGTWFLFKPDVSTENRFAARYHAFIDGKYNFSLYNTYGDEVVDSVDINPSAANTLLTPISSTPVWADRSVVNTQTHKWNVGDKLHTPGTAFYTVIVRTTSHTTGELAYYVKFYSKSGDNPLGGGVEHYFKESSIVDQGAVIYNPEDVASQEQQTPKYKIGQWFYDKDWSRYYLVVGIESNGYRVEWYTPEDLHNKEETSTHSFDKVESGTELGIAVDDPRKVQPNSTIEGVLTREQHMQSLLAAAEKYSVVIGDRENLVDALMKYSPNVSVGDICEAFFSETGSSGTRLIGATSNGTISVKQQGGDLFGAPLSLMERKIHLKSSYAYHDYLKMAPSSQGGGATKELFRRTVPLFEKMGLKKIKVYANIQVGAAIWSKYGFKDTGDESSYRNKLSLHLMRIDDLKKDLGNLSKSSGYTDIHQRELDGIITILSDLKEKPYFSDWPAYVCSLSCPNVESDFQKQIKTYCPEASEKVEVSIGKFLNWGMSYDGELVFSDKQSYNRMAKYSGLPRKE